MEGGLAFDVAKYVGALALTLMAAYSRGGAQGGTGVLDTAAMPRQFWTAAALGAIVLVGSIGKDVQGYLRKRRERSSWDLHGCLHTLHGTLLATALQGEADPGLRVTLHRPLPSDRVEQICDYVGRSGKGAGRCFSARAGVVGQALRTRQYVIADRENDDAELYITELVNVWNYTMQEAKSLDHTVRAWMAVPVKQGDSVEGVLYVDSVQRGYFTEQRRDLILGACVGIARFVGQRYGS